MYHEEMHDKLCYLMKGQRIITTYPKFGEICHLSQSSINDLLTELSSKDEEIELLRRRLERHYDY